MDCRRAVALMREALDAQCRAEGDLAQHLRECEACQRTWSRQQRLMGLVGKARTCPPDAQQRADRAIAWATARSSAAAGLRLQAAAAAQTRALQRRSLLPHLAWACVAVAAFCVGYRLHTPQVVERTAQAPVVAEKVVRVEVPVIRDRVVQRVVRVPVVRTRVVTRIVHVPVTGPDSPGTEVDAAAPDAARARVADAPTDEVPEPLNRLVQTYPMPDPLPAADYRETVCLAKLAPSSAGE